MRIGIVTLPLVSNYGGYLQAWALQEKLRKMGHDPITVDYRRRLPWACLLRQWTKTFVLRCIGKVRPYLEATPQRSNLFANFVSKNIKMTKLVNRYSENLLSKYKLEAIVVGSDQVWRAWKVPGFILEDYFLRFVKSEKILKVAYAASFGVDEWIYTPSQTKKCSRLAMQFNAISVRENSGVALCKDYLGVEAVEVLDPTLLHTSADYEKLCAGVPVQSESVMLCYILDKTPEKSAYIEKMAQERGLSLREVTAEIGAELSVEQWLAMFRDARFVVTDSFHGTVFSILFHKPFVSIVNSERGATRFYSLLKRFGLEERLMKTLDDSVFFPEIDWSIVDIRLDESRKQSTQFLLNALNC